MIQSDKNLVGVWVDNSKAWIVRYDKGSESIVKIESQDESRVKETGGSRMARIPHHKIEGHRREQAHKYYQEIISKLNDVDDLVLMGPSSAKVELKKCIAKHKPLGERLRDTIPADHLTERQIAARVREYFHLGNEMESKAV